MKASLMNSPQGSAARLPRFGLAALALSLLSACASVSQADLPTALAPEAGMQFLTRVGARGVQIYECRATGSNATPAWAFVAPEADLFDRDNRKVGTHGAGPFWQAHDGSRIVGQVAGRVDAPVAGAIDWLLLKTKNVGPEGRYSRVGTIQRINTVGGMAPSKGCAKATLGVTARIEYTADYNLYTAR